MGLKKINARGMTLIAIAGFLLLMAILSNFKHKSIDAADDPPGPLPAPVLPAAEPPASSQHFYDEDEAAQREMKDQMEKDRVQQRRIKVLKMQLEQADLQLDNEKALTQINKLKKENTGYVKDPSSPAGIDFPGIRVMYIGGTDAEKEAIVSIDGTSYPVRAKDRPVANVEILGVSDQGVKVRFSAPKELTTVINYIQD